eukprot:4646485-Pyramimonas_sp.AAC.1
MVSLCRCAVWSASMAGLSRHSCKLLSLLAHFFSVWLPLRWRRPPRCLFLLPSFLPPSPLSPLPVPAGAGASIVV